MFWAWLLQYSSLLVTGAVSFVVGYALHLITSRRADLIHYTSHQQWVTIQPPQGQPIPPPIGTVTLFLWNNGRAPAREVHVGHAFLPSHNVYPDIPRQVEPTPGGGTAIRFPMIPPKTLVSISYLFSHPLNVDGFLSYVGSEEGASKRIPVMLQRIWPAWWLRIVVTILFAGIWVVVNFAWTLIKFLWHVYYAP